jgi:hypothetical protein
MTITVLDTKELFTGNGVLTTYSFGFKIDTTAELLVALVAVDGTETPLTLDVDYTVVLNVSQNTNPGGVVTFTVAPGVGVPFVVMRNVEFARGTEFTNSVPPHVIESELDRLTMYAQQLKEKLDRSLHVSAVQATPPDLNYKNVAARQSGLAGFDDYGQAAVYTFSGGSIVGPNGPVLASRVELDAPAVFRQASNGDWSHEAVNLDFIWTVNGTLVDETRELEVTIDPDTGLFIDPALTEPGDDFTTTLDPSGQLLQVAATHNGQREYVQLAIITLPSDEAFVTDEFAPAWGSGEFTGGDPVGSIVYADRSGVVSLFIEAALTGVSDSAALTWDAGTIPAAIRPAQPRSVQCTLQADDTTEAQGQVLIGTDGSAVFTLLEGDAATVGVAGEFQTGEDKGLPEHWNVTYPL